MSICSEQKKDTDEYCWQGYTCVPIGYNPSYFVWHFTSESALQVNLKRMNQIFMDSIHPYSILHVYYSKLGPHFAALLTMTGGLHGTWFLGNLRI